MGFIKILKPVVAALKKIVENQECFGKLFQHLNLQEKAIKTSKTAMRRN